MTAMTSEPQTTGIQRIVRAMGGWINGTGVPREQPGTELLLGPDTWFSGHLRCRNTVIIEGMVENALIETSANIIIAEDARVGSDLSARIVSIRGTYSGTLTADRVEILQGAEVHGHVHVNTIYIDENAVMKAEMFLLGSADHRPQASPTEITSDVITRTTDVQTRPPPEIGA